VNSKGRSADPSISRVGERNRTVVAFRPVSTTFRQELRASPAPFRGQSELARDALDIGHLEGGDWNVIAHHHAAIIRAESPR